MLRGRSCVVPLFEGFHVFVKETSTLFLSLAMTLNFVPKSLQNIFICMLNSNK